MNGTDSGFCRRRKHANIEHGVDRPDQFVCPTPSVSAKRDPAVIRRTPHQRAGSQLSRTDPLESPDNPPARSDVILEPHTSFLVGVTGLVCVNRRLAQSRWFGYGYMRCGRETAFNRARCSSVSSQSTAPRFSSS